MCKIFSPSVTKVDTRYDIASSNKYSVHDGVCELGRMVATCGYMEHHEVQERLKHSIRAMDALMATIDANPAMPKPNGLTSYQTAHKKWFTTLWDNGIAKLQKQLVDSAKFLADPANKNDYAALPEAIRTKVDALAGADGDATAQALCGGAFTYP